MVYVEYYDNIRYNIHYYTASLILACLGFFRSKIVV